MAGTPSAGDRDLLARLNALKQSPVELDDKKPLRPVHKPTKPLDAEISAGQALHSDLLSRFKSLGGKSLTSSGASEVPNSKNETDLPPLAEDDKTIDELLADLGPADSWSIEEDEETQINNLLRSARTALKENNAEGAALDPTGNDLQKERAASRIHELPSVDIQFSHPAEHAGEWEEEVRNYGNDDDEEEVDEPRKTKAQLEADVDSEADAIIARIKDELKHAPVKDPATDGAESNSDNGDKIGNDEKPEETKSKQKTPKSSFSLPAAPSFDLPTSTSNQNQHEGEKETDETDLSSRFATLSLPTVPSTLLPNPSSLTKSSNIRSATNKNLTTHTDDEIDTWCTICTDDATLSCLGCDGEKYCTKCWIEGHKGPDAGYEERTHKALAYNKGSKKEKRKVRVGAQ